MPAVYQAIHEMESQMSELQKTSLRNLRTRPVIHLHELPSKTQGAETNLDGHGSSRIKYKRAPERKRKNDSVLTGGASEGIIESVVEEEIEDPLHPPSIYKTASWTNRLP